MVIAGCTTQDPAPTTTTASTTTTVPTFTGDRGSEFCRVLRDVDLRGVLEGDADTPEEVAAGFGRLVEVLEQAEGVSPPEVRDDAGLLAERVSHLNRALAEVGYDFDALAVAPRAAAAVRAVNDPAFAVANERLEAYRGQVCDS